MAGGIFISYRRGDGAQFAGRLYDRLSEAFRGHDIFLDVDNLAPGQDFVGVLEQKVTACDVFLAVIGPGWVDAKDRAGRRRLDNPDDFVRIEIAAALAADKLVAPILVDDTDMPLREELPEPLQPLVRRHAMRISHESFSSDADRLIRTLSTLLKPLAPDGAPQRAHEPPAIAVPAGRRRASWPLAALGAMLLAAVAVGGYFLIYPPRAGVERALGMVETWETPEYREAVDVISARLGYLSNLYASELPPDATEEQRKVYLSKLGSVAMTPEGGSMPYPEYRPHFDLVMQFLNRVSTCATSGLCDMPVVDQYFRDYATTFWDHFSGFVATVRADGNPGYAVPLEEYVRHYRI